MIKALAAIFICLTVCSACVASDQVSPESPPAVPPEPLPREIALSQWDNGRQLEVYVGQVLVLTLSASPSTGYTWEVTDIDEKVLRQVGKAEFVPDKNMPGSPGKMILRFEVVGDGSSSLNLLYHRPWEKDVTPASSFAIQVTASPATTPLEDKTETDKGRTEPSTEPAQQDLPKE